jgi:hypothetical protein
MKNEMIQHTNVEVNAPDTDFKAEVIAAALLQMNIPAEKIFIRRMGINNRARNKDIICLRKDFFEFNEEQIVIDTNRESIYNYLPEGIFHPPTLGGLGKNTEEIIEQMRIERKAEEDGKKFFVPFELETYYTELAALNFENNLDQKGKNDHLLDIISDLWPLLNTLDKATAKIFIHLLPFFHSARGNKIWFERCMTAFLGVPVNIGFSENKVDEIDNIETLFLANTRLGINTLLCGSHTDGNRNWHVNIGPVPTQELYRYIPGSSFNETLAAVCNHCLPATALWQLHIVTAKEGEDLVLGGNEEAQFFLGYNTFL